MSGIPDFRIAKRLEKVESFIVMDVLDRATDMERRGISVTHLEIGEPDFPTPKGILEAGVEALQRGETHYTHSLGIYPLREAIAGWYKRQYGVTVEPEQVVVTMGTSPGLLLLLSVLLNPGDEVILSNPCYACYPNFLHYLGSVPAYVEVSEANGFQFDPSDIRRRITPRTRAIMINSPSNPTGNLLSIEVMQEISQLGIPIISDEIYHGLVYEGRAHSILEFTSNAFVLNGFSKLFAMTGWRLGYVIVPREFVRPIQKLQQNFFISPNAFVQWAGVAALTQEHPELEQMRRTYDQRRRFMIRRLREMGFGVAVEPTGAFYIFANARAFCANSYAFAFEILEEAHVAVAPGIDFGSNGEGFLRFSYANSLENIRVGMDRLQAFLQRRSSRTRE